jgi:hypothetical protein
MGDGSTLSAIPAMRHNLLLLVEGRRLLATWRWPH